MTNFRTVYFDTSFFVDLERASERVANKCIERLNGLHIRPVCSLIVLVELLKGKGPSSQLHKLFNRIMRFKIDSLRIPQEADWLLLLIPYFPGLKPFAQGFLDNTLEAWTKGASWGYSARVDNNPHLLELIELAKRQGAPSTPEEALPFTEDLLLSIGV